VELIKILEFHELQRGLGYGKNIFMVSVGNTTLCVVRFCSKQNVVHLYFRSMIRE